MTRSTCPRCKGWGFAHFHWCTAVGGLGFKPGAEATIPVPEPASPVAPARPDPAPEVVATSPVAAPPARAPRRTAPRPLTDNDRSELRRRNDRVLMHERVEQPEPTYPRAEARRIAQLRDQLAELPPVQKWRHIVGEARVDWVAVDDDQLGAVAHSLALFCRTHGLPITYKIQPDVLALEGFDETQVHAALTSPQRVDVRPETWQKDKRYPVLSFRRGDVNVILGLREVDAPAVIAAYWTSLLAGYDPTAHRDRTGGGGAKLGGGLPTTPKALVRRLSMMNAYVDPEWSMSNDPVEVTYDGQSLGKIPVSPRTPKAEIESAYNRCQRKINAIDMRATSPAGAR